MFNALKRHASPEGCGYLSRLGSGEKNLSRPSGTKVASRPSERARASQLAGDNIPGYAKQKSFAPAGAREWSFPKEVIPLNPPSKCESRPLNKCHPLTPCNSMQTHATLCNTPPGASRTALYPACVGPISMFLLCQSVAPNQARKSRESNQNSTAAGQFL